MNPFIHCNKTKSSRTHTEQLVLSLASCPSGVFKVHNQYPGKSSSIYLEKSSTTSRILLKVQNKSAFNKINVEVDSRFF